MSDGLLDYIPIHPDVPHPLGRSVVWHDPRNRQYRALDTDPGRKRLWPWWARHCFDQQGSSCTMQSAVGVAATSPFRKKLKPLIQAYDTEYKRHQGYLKAQQHDPWRGGEPEYEGSSTDAPFKLLRAEGYIPGWNWVFGVDELKQVVRRVGPVSVGTVWLWSMFDVDSKGYLIVQEDSGDAGGHAYEVQWYDESDDEFWILNSWGRKWGRKGRARVHGSKMRYLLEEREGEACTIRL